MSTQTNVSRSDLLRISYLVEETINYKDSGVRNKDLIEARRILLDILDLSKTQLRNYWMFGGYLGER